MKENNCKSLCKLTTFLGLKNQNTETLHVCVTFLIGIPQFFTDPDTVTFPAVLLVISSECPDSVQVRFIRGSGMPPGLGILVKVVAPVIADPTCSMA